MTSFYSFLVDQQNNSSYTFHLFFPLTKLWKLLNYFKFIFQYLLKYNLRFQPPRMSQTHSKSFREMRRQLYIIYGVFHTTPS